MQYTQQKASAWTTSMNQTLVNTYRLLSATLLFSGVMAYVSMAMGFPHLGLFTLVGYFGLLFVVTKLQNSSYGILAVFALTGFMGLTLGPILNYYLATNPAIGCKHLLELRLFLEVCLFTQLFQRKILVLWVVCLWWA